GRRKAKAAEPAPAAAEARPVKRRRTAAEVAQFEAQAEAERAAERAAALELERPVLAADALDSGPAQTLEERARALFKDLPPLPSEEESDAATTVAEPPAPAEPSAPAAPAGMTPGGATPKAPFIPPRIQRPAPGAAPAGQVPGGVPGRPGVFPPRPKPVFSSSVPATPARPPIDRGAPVRAFGPDAEKGAGRKKGKKGKRSLVDQEAVQANILRTLQNIKGTGRKGVRRPEEPSYREQLADRLAEEREREKTRIRVNEYISVSELAELMKVPATQIVQFAFKELGMMVT